MTAPARDADVPEFVAALGVPGLFDLHTHFLPPRMLRSVRAYFDEAGPLVGRRWPLLYRGTNEESAAYLTGLGVRRFSALAYAHRPGMAADLNSWTLAFAARTPGCLRSATFFPEPGVLDEVRRVLDAGAQVFKVHLQVSGYDPREAVLDPVWGLLAEAGVPVVVHAGSGPVANDYTGPGPIGDVLARHPRLVVVLAHLGAPEYDYFLDLAAGYERVCLDTTMAFTEFFEDLAPFPRGRLPELKDLGLAGRVVLGTDFPNIPQPYAAQLTALAGLGLGDDWLRAVCWDNGAALVPGR